MGVDPAWVAAGLLFLTSTGGWVVTIVRNGKSQAEKFGKLSGQMDGLGERMSGIESNVGGLTNRIDGLVDGINDGRRRTKETKP